MQSPLSHLQLISSNTSIASTVEEVEPCILVNGYDDLDQAYTQRHMGGASLRASPEATA